MSETGKEVAVLGVGMHPWGKWGRNFVEYGVEAAQRRARRRRARVERRPVRRRRRHDPQRLPRLRRRRDVRAGARLERRAGRELATARARPARRPSSVARAQILAGLCDVALVVGADTTPKGFFAPTAGGDRTQDPDWLRFRLLGATNPIYFGLYARRRMDLFGATEARLRAGEGQEQPPRPREPERALPQEALHARTRCSRRRSCRDPLRLLEICATSDGGAALVLSSMDYARKRAHASPVRDRRGLDGDAALPEHRDRDAELRHRLGGRRGVAVPDVAVPRLDREGGLRGGRASGPRTSTLAEVYDLSSALELDWYENIGLCKPGEAEKLLRDGRHRDRRPHPGEPERRARVLRRGDPRAGDRAGVRAHVAAPRPGRRAPGRGREASASR